MARRSSEAVSDGDEIVPERQTVSAYEIASVRQTQEELATARCPICRYFLVARLGREGPYFFCRCVRKPAKKAA